MSHVKFLGKVVTKKGNKDYYNKIMIGANVYSVGNFVHLNSDDTSRDAKPYIALIQSFYKIGQKELMRVKWLFRTEDTHLHSSKNRNQKHEFDENEVFFSRDEDENDVKTIMQRVYVYPDGSAASKQTNPSKPTYSCCLEYLPAKKKFKPLLDTSILSTPPKLKPTFDDDTENSNAVIRKKKKKERGGGANNTNITTTNSSSSSSSSSSRDTTAIGNIDKSSHGRTLRSAASDSDGSSNDGEGESDAVHSSVSSEESFEEEITEIRIGPDYQVTNIPDVVVNNKDIGKEQGDRTGYDDLEDRYKPTLLYDCNLVVATPIRRRSARTSSNQQKSSTNTKKMSERKHYKKNQRVYVDLPEESKYCFPATILSHDIHKRRAKLQLIDGTIRTDTPESSINAINAPEHLLYGLSLEEMNGKDNNKAINGIPQLWNAFQYHKLHRLHKQFAGEKYDLIASKMKEDGKSERDVYAFFEFMREREKVSIRNRKPTRFSQCDICKRKSASSNMISCNQCETMFCRSCEQLTGGVYVGKNKTRWHCNVCSGKSPRNSRIRGKKISTLLTPKSKIAVLNLLRPDGSWACAQCTYINPARKKKCNICKARAPFSSASTSIKRKRNHLNGSSSSSGRKRPKTTALPGSPVIHDNQRVLLASVQYITKLKHYIFKENQSSLVDLDGKKKMFMDILQKLKLFSNWKPWPDTSNLNQLEVQERFVIFDSIQDLFKKHGALKQAHREELTEDFLSFFPEKIRTLYKEKDSTGVVNGEVAL
eukprot:g998.t1